MRGLQSRSDEDFGLLAQSGFSTTATSPQFSVQPPAGNLATVSDFTALLSAGWNGVDAVGKSAFVTYSFSTAAQFYLSEFQTEEFVQSFVPFTSAQMDAARVALQQWADVSGLVFIEAPAGLGDVQFGRFALTDASGFAYYPSYPAGSPISGDVFIEKDISESADISYLLLHEIGHAIGFKHPHDGEPTLDASLDNRTNTVMSYVGQVNANHVLGPLDIEAAAYVYGGASADGSHVSSWSWDATSSILTQIGFASDDELHGVFSGNIIDGGGGADEIHGGYGIDHLTGGAGDDLVAGYDGSDFLNGGSGADNMYGGGGDDTFYVSDAADMPIEAIAAGRDRVIATINWMLGANIENLTLSGAAALTGAGNELGNLIVGNGAANVLSGADGADDLRGAGGNDVLDGGALNDALNGGAGIDAATYVNSDFGVHINLAAGTAEGGEAEGDTFVSVENLIGSSFDDLLLGNAAANAMDGGAGNDVLNGGAGADVMAGGVGDDAYYVDNVADTATEELGAGADTLIASRSWAVGSNFERVYLTGTGDFNVAGNGLANTLKGNSGDNWINGSFGKDTLTGGGGRDSFIFNRALGPNNIDTITDYDIVRDVIRIDNAVFTGIGAAGAFSAAMFNIGAAASEADDRIIYDPATGKLFFDIDGTGAAAQIHFATLSTKPTGMTAAEFIVI